MPFYMTTFSNQMIELLPHDQVLNWPFRRIQNRAEEVFRVNRG